MLALAADALAAVSPASPYGWSFFRSSPRNLRFLFYLVWTLIPFLLSMHFSLSAMIVSLISFSHCIVFGMCARTSEVVAWRICVEIGRF